MCNQPQDMEWSKYPAVVLEPQPVPPKAANIAECSIATDSVVATATVRTDATMRRIVVKWGDGTINTLRHRPGIEAAIGQQSQLPLGTYKFNHAYAAPEDRHPFEQFVLIRVEDQSGGIDFCIRKITLTPRYRVTNYRTTLTLASKCDSWFESRSEFDITQYIDGAIANYWRWEPSEPGPFEVGVEEIPFRLEGSLVSRELTVADASVPVFLEIVEKDSRYDDSLPHIYQNLSAFDVSETIEREKEEEGSGGCKVKYRYDREVALIVPLPSFGQTAVFNA